jgi:transposase
MTQRALAPNPTCSGCQHRDEVIAALQVQVADLQRQVDDLRRQLEQSQQAGKRQATPFRRTRHVENPSKPGRPKGHPWSTRPLPTTEPDRILPVPCDLCPDCQQPLINPVVHQQFQTDLPPVVPLVTRFDVHGGTCPCCRRYHQGRHPEMTSAATGAAANQIGPVALTMAAELKHRLGVSYRKITDFFLTYFRLKVSHATLVRAEQRLARRAEPTFRLLQEALRACGVVHADETGWRIGRLNAWLWVFTCDRGTIYAIRTSRGHEVAQEILGEHFGGILVVDGWSAYDVLDCRKGRCNGHILRRCRDLLQQGQAEADAALLRRFMAILRAGLALAKRYPELSAPEYERQWRAWEDDFDGWLLEEAVQAGEEVQRLRRHVLSHHDEFMRHLLVPGVPPTNDAAERMIRPSVIVRKVGGCNRTLRGALVHGVLASVMVSIRQRGKRFLELALALWRQATPEALDWSCDPVPATEVADLSEPQRGRRSDPVAGVASG